MEVLKLNSILLESTLMSQMIELSLTENTTCTAPLSIVKEVHDLKDEMVQNRRWFHMYPELSFEEVITSAKVAELLASYGITEIHTNIAKTGVVAMIRGAHPGPCVGLRADMDGLPVPETADIPYRSTTNAMHACGHDGHMTILLAAAKVLFNERHRLHGSVKLLFQPAEERYGGADPMIKEGCLEDGPLGPYVDSVYGLHLWSFGPLGHVQCSEGPVMAATDTFDIKVRGSGGHGAVPHAAVDAIVTAASLVTSLQTVISRNTDPLESGVLTCGEIKGGVAHNVIADQVFIRGTCRSFRPNVQDTIERRMGEICCGCAMMNGANVDIDYKRNYPATVNAYPECVAIVNKASAAVVGADRAGKPQRTMGAEDFSYFLEKRPGCFFFVGAALPGDVRPHHKSIFDFDENALFIGASVFVNVIRDLLVPK